MDDDKKFTIIGLTGGLWAVASVADRPELVLASWQVFELTLPGRPRTRHFAGYNLTDGEGRASSAITTFDAASGRGVTSSGRVYQLTGRPGLNMDAEYVWRRWMEINGVTEPVDVTSEVHQQLIACGADIGLR